MCPFSQKQDSHPTINLATPFTINFLTTSAVELYVSVRRDRRTFQTLSGRQCAEFTEIKISPVT